MRNIIYMFTITLCAVSTQLFAQDKQDEIIAIWDTREAQVEIHKVDDRYIGNPINPEGERNSEIEILHLEYENGKWVGHIFSQKRNRSLDVVCVIEGDKLLLEVSADRISRDLEWTRVQ